MSTLDFTSKLQPHEIDYFKQIAKEIHEGRFYLEEDEDCYCEVCTHNCGCDGGDCDCVCLFVRSITEEAKEESILDCWFRIGSVVIDELFIDNGLLFFDYPELNNMNLGDFVDVGRFFLDGF